jgi:hypothetical protein
MTSSSAAFSVVVTFSRAAVSVPGRRGRVNVPGRRLGLVSRRLQHGGETAGLFVLSFTS